LSSEGALSVLKCDPAASKVLKGKGSTHGSSTSDRALEQE
jgi:hypothetical protein